MYCNVHYTYTVIVDKFLLSFEKTLYYIGVFNSNKTICTQHLIFKKYQKLRLHIKNVIRLLSITLDKK